jgi:hypothetical protein
MAYTSINKPTDYFNTKLYTGTGSSQSITGVGFQPDWVWIKKRSATDGSRMFDVVRGASKGLFTDSNAEEVTVSSEHTSFDSDGFSLGSSENVNESSGTFVAWNWLAGGSASSNSNGSITSSVSANTTAGFSIVSFTGNATSGATVGHGLGSVPKMIIVKNRIDAQPWWVYHSSIGAGGQLRLEESDAKGSDGGVLWNSTEPTSSVFTLGDNGGANGSGDATIAYCFAEKKGYSKFGSYKGNSSANGTFVYTGFRPAFIITKATTTGQSYQLYDNKRNTFNQSNKVLFPNHSYAEQDDSSAAAIDILSNGFKQRVNDAGGNSSSHTYIYWAFAESPFVNSNGVPTNAR